MCPQTPEIDRPDRVRRFSAHGVPGIEGFGRATGSDRTRHRRAKLTLKRKRAWSEEDEDGETEENDPWMRSTYRKEKPNRFRKRSRPAAEVPGRGSQDHPAARPRKTIRRTQKPAKAVATGKDQEHSAHFFPSRRSAWIDPQGFLKRSSSRVPKTQPETSPMAPIPVSVDPIATTPNPTVTANCGPLWVYLMASRPAPG